MIEFAVCELRASDGSSCSKPAFFFCDNGHALCSTHAPHYSSPERRRKTDRRCAVCGSCTIDPIKSIPKALDRRRPPNPPR
jgi:hypothetical protein